eukprot:7704649-Pyramimonas_sp.AAC.1
MARRQHQARPGMCSGRPQQRAAREGPAARAGDCSTVGRRRAGQASCCEGPGVRGGLGLHEAVGVPAEGREHRRRRLGPGVLRPAGRGRVRLRGERAGRAQAAPGGAPGHQGPPPDAQRAGHGMEGQDARHAERHPRAHGQEEERSGGPGRPDRASCPVLAHGSFGQRR